MLFQDTSCSQCNSGHSNALEVALKRLCCRRAGKGSPEGGERGEGPSGPPLMPPLTPASVCGTHPPAPHWEGYACGLGAAGPRPKRLLPSRSPRHPVHCPSTRKGKPQCSACHSARPPRPPTLSRGTASCGRVLTSTWTPDLQESSVVSVSSEQGTRHGLSRCLCVRVNYLHCLMRNQHCHNFIRN